MSHGEGNATEKKDEFRICGNEGERPAGRSKLKTEIYQRKGDEEEEKCRKLLDEGKESSPGVLR